MDTSNIPPNPPPWQPNSDPASIVVPGLDTDASLVDQIEQMEQLITIKLQNIDENFSKIHSVLANRILPAVKRYAVATKPVREAAKFWVSFYEQAAQIRIPTSDDYSTVNEVPSERDDVFSEAESSARTAEQTVRQGENSVSSTEHSFMPQAAFASTPATARAGRSFPSEHSEAPSWSNSLESPVTILGRDVQNYTREGSSLGSKLPSLHFGTEPDEDDTIVRPRADKGPEPLLQSVLRHTLYSDLDASPSKGKIKTPVPSRLNPYLPPNIEPADWSGLVDLRRTPLSTPSRKYNPIDDDDDSFDGLPPGMSPPKFMSPAKPPRSTAELQLLRGKTPAKEAASRIKNDLVREAQRQNSAQAHRLPGDPLSGGESSLSTVSSPPSMSRYNRADTDDSALDTSLESVMRRVALDPPAWTPSGSTPGLRLRPKVPAPAFSQPSPIPAPPAQYPTPLDDDGFITPHRFDPGNNSFDSEDSLEDEVNNTAHPSAAFLMAAGGSNTSFDEDDSFQSQDSLDRADAEAERMGIVDVHPFARAGFVVDAADDSFDDDSYDAGETVFGRQPAQRAPPRLSAQGDLLMYGDEASVLPDTVQYGMVGSSPTPHWGGGGRN